jgi:hypothetical protein
VQTFSPGHPHLIYTVVFNNMTMKWLVNGKDGRVKSAMEHPAVNILGLPSHFDSNLFHPLDAARKEAR